MLKYHNGSENLLLPLFVCLFFVLSQTATSSGRKRSGVNQRCQCKSLSGYEGGWQIAGLGKQQFLVCVLCVCICIGGYSPRSVLSSFCSSRTYSTSLYVIYQGAISSTKLLSVN